MRIRRRRRMLRAVWKSRELQSVRNRTARIKPNDVLLFCTARNEQIRLPYFLNYYRDMGVDHFIFVDNASDDGTDIYLADQEDVSLWRTDGSYRAATYGVDWLNGLLRRYGHGHWTLVVDPDEFLVYPFCDTRPVRALTDWLDESGIRSFSAMLLDMYPKGPLNTQTYTAGCDPFESACWFDSGNYTLKKNPIYGNLWIQGGPRSRVFFADRPEQAPALNKIPLVKWNWRYTYVSSTHALLPRGLNQVYEDWGGEKASGVLMHAKFLDMFQQKATEELHRRQHFAGSAEYLAYADPETAQPDLWCEWSEKYKNWHQLDELGLMSKGNWT
ncbi:glycosyltransferase family 2 protein [Rhodobacteraceae bacterium F11138]|nr:glycosyltransferase family 2 protein [Rhodobacteraceae bacterium F11138]